MTRQQYVGHVQPSMECHTALHISESALGLATRGMLTFDAIFCDAPLGIPLHAARHQVTDVVILQ